MRNPIKATRFRAVLSGNMLELYEFEDAILYGFSATKGKILRDREEDNGEDSRKRARYRSRAMVKRLVNCNFGMWIDAFGKPYLSKFLTLTFRDNIQEVKEGNKQFTLFIKRLNYIAFESKKSVVQYLSVIEFQPKSGRVHYHVALFNLPFIPQYIDVFNQAWDRGFLWIERIKNERYAANYITKYMTKEHDDRLRGEKSYFCSRGLKKPLIVRSEERVLEIKNSLATERAIFTKTFKSEQTGETKYFCYDIKNNAALKDLIMLYSKL